MRSDTAEAERAEGGAAGSNAVVPGAQERGRSTLPSRAVRPQGRATPECRIPRALGAIDRGVLGGSRVAGRAVPGIQPFFSPLLAALLIEHGVGVSPERTYIIPKADADLFEEA